MKYYYSLFICFISFSSLFSQVKVCSWNLKNFGKTKADSTINFIANTIRDCDIIAIQEVVAGIGGAQAVARLNEALDKKGAKWDYTVSIPTISSAYKTERYAFLWKTHRIKKKGKAWLEQTYKMEIDREPYFCTFEYEKKNFTLVNFHAITKKKQPETEIKYFKFLPAQYSDKNLIFVGDFNCPQSHTVFNPLKKMGYKPVLNSQKTSLKQECKQKQCLASEFDNIFYNSLKIKRVNAGVISFYKEFESLKEAKSVSDHIPVWFSFTIL